jgi:hypothetical protein
MRQFTLGIMFFGVALLLSLTVRLTSAQTAEPTAQPTVAATVQPTVEPTTQPDVPPPGLPDNPPATAGEGLSALAIAIATLAGLAGARLTTLIKNLPFLQEGEKSKLSGLVADLVAFVLSTGIAYLVTYLTPVAATLDNSGLWQVLVWSWPAAKAWYEVERHRKATV